MSSRAEHGFTLLEVLVSVAIMAAVITFAFRAFRDIQDAYDRVSGNLNRDRAAQVLLDRIESELVGTTMVQRIDGADPLLHPFLFVSDDATLGQEGSDSVRFVTQTPIRAPGAETEGGLMMVTYGVESETVDLHHLMRTEEPLPLEAQSDIRLDDAQLVADEVASFQLRFRGPGGEWSRGWDSTGASVLDQLPEAVELVVRLWERDAQGELVEGAEHIREVALLVRPFSLSPAGPNSPGDEQNTCEDGISVTDCLASIEADLQSRSSPWLQGEIQRLASQISEPCWNAEPASEQLEKLRGIVEEQLLIEACQ